MKYEMKEIFDDIPFAPAYDPVIPVDVKEEERGVLCIITFPSSGVYSVRVERNIAEIMDKLKFVTRYTHLLKFYELGNKMLIENNECKVTIKDALIYNGQPFDITGCMLICNKGFKSLTQTEALKILESAKLIRSPMGTCKVVINIEE